MEYFRSDRLNTIGIIVNPASGKDIRRLVSHAMVIDNNEKLNIVKRIILAAQGAGIKKMYIMPDTFSMGYKVVDNLTSSKELLSEVEIIDMKVKGNADDSIMATSIMQEKGVGCIIALGGDGTSRAVAKAIKDTPLISISTGTNNVYPLMLEGTVVGIAAAAISTQTFDIRKTCSRDKRIEIYKDDEMIDIALIDCVISRQTFIGSKAIWDFEDIQKVIVSRAHPASIGFSAIVGVKFLVGEDSDFGASINVNVGENNLLVPIAAGSMESITVDEPIIHPLNEFFSIEMKYNGIMALDGEREIPFKEGQIFKFRITREGPLRVNVNATLEEAQKNGFFMR